MTHKNYVHMINGSAAHFEDLQRNMPGRHLGAADVRMVLRQFQDILIRHIRRNERIGLRIRICSILAYKIPLRQRPLYAPWARLTYKLPFWEVEGIQIESAPHEHKRVRIQWDAYSSPIRPDFRKIAHYPLVDISPHILVYDTEVLAENPTHLKN